jgi:hypothetical protein
MIETLYVANHTHTDIGFTDHQDVCFRQHAEFVTQAMDVIEATAGYPEEARFRWTCEVTGPLERYLANGDADRFRHHNASGAMDVAAMQYNLTPLLGVEQMVRSLMPVRRLRERYGLTIRSAMQDDVNGISWLFADLLPAIGVQTLTLAINQMRGRAPKPLPGAFWWEGPAGGKLLCWNGLHYLFGRSVVKLADPRHVERDLAALVRRRERSGLPVRLPLRRVDAPDARRQRPARAARQRLRGRVERGGEDAAHRAHDAGRLRGRAAPARAPDLERRLDRLVVRRRRLERVRDRPEPHDARAARRRRGDRRVDRHRRPRAARRPV